MSAQNGSARPFYNFTQFPHFHPSCATNQERGLKNAVEPQGFGALDP